MLKQAARKLLSRFLTAGYLPCGVLSRRPLIVAAYDTDFLKAKEDFLTAFAPYRRVDLLLQLGWQHETPKVVEPFVRDLAEVRRRAPQLNVTVLANSPTEVETLSGFGIRTVLCHQNAFLDESLYKIIPGVEKRFDALYIARITPFKRHRLAAQVESLELIGDYSEKEQLYVEATLAELRHARWVRGVPARRIYRHINRARCGLCLSAEEGAMFVSAEYLLCGIPIVNTANIGGRDFLFPEFAVKTVADAPEAVAAAVAEWKNAAPPPEDIRRAVLENMRIHRAILLKMLNEICREARAADPEGPESFTGTLPHKLALRCTRMPWTNWKFGLPRPGGK